MKRALPADDDEGTSAQSKRPRLADAPDRFHDDAVPSEMRGEIRTHLDPRSLSALACVSRQARDETGRGHLPALALARKRILALDNDELRHWTRQAPPSMTSLMSLAFGIVDPCLRRYWAGLDASGPWEYFHRFAGITGRFDMFDAFQAALHPYDADNPRYNLGEAVWNHVQHMEDAASQGHVAYLQRCLAVMPPTFILFADNLARSAVEHGHVNVLRWLFDAGLLPAADHGKVYVCLATRYGRLDCLRYLHEERAMPLDALHGLVAPGFQCWHSYELLGATGDEATAHAQGHAACVAYILAKMTPDLLADARRRMFRHWAFVACASGHIACVDQWLSRPDWSPYPSDREAYYREVLACDDPNVLDVLIRRGIVDGTPADWLAEALAKKALACAEHLRDAHGARIRSRLQLLGLLDGAWGTDRANWMIKNEALLDTFVTGAGTMSL